MKVEQEAIEIYLERDEVESLQRAREILAMRKLARQAQDLGMYENNENGEQPE